MSSRRVRVRSARAPPSRRGRVNSRTRSRTRSAIDRHAFQSFVSIGPSQPRHRPPSTSPHNLLRSLADEPSSQHAYYAYAVVDAGFHALTDGRAASITTLTDTDTDLAAYLLAATALLGPKKVRPRAIRALSQLGEVGTPYREALGLIKQARVLSFNELTFEASREALEAVNETPLAAIEREGRRYYTSESSIDASDEQPFVPCLVLVEGAKPDLLRRPSATFEAIEDLPCIVPPLRGRAAWYGLPNRLQWLYAPLLSASEPWSDDEAPALIPQILFAGWRVREGVAFLVWQGDADALARLTGLSDAPWPSLTRPWSLRSSVPG